MARGNPNESEDELEILRPAHACTSRKTGPRYSPRRAQAPSCRGQDPHRPGRAPRRGKHCKYWKVGVRDFHFFGPLSYATSPYENTLSALGGLGNSRVFAGFSLETLMVRGRNSRAFSLRIGGFSPKLEGWPIFPTRFNALI